MKPKREKDMALSLIISCLLLAGNVQREWEAVETGFNATFSNIPRPPASADGGKFLTSILMQK